MVSDFETQKINESNKERKGSGLIICESEMKDW